MPKPDLATLDRIKRTEVYAENVRRMFAQTVNDILALNKRVPVLEPGEMFSFEDEKNARMLRETEALLRRLHSASTMAIEKGIKLEWATANDETDKLLASCFGKRVLEDSNFRGWMSRNNEARQAFITRTERGMNLSERVWKSTRQLRDEMEVAMTVAIGEGDSAASMSRKVRQYLNDPDLMFRRFRYKDEDGNWQRKWKKRITDPETGRHTWIDYDKDSYRDQWTGRGYYKSSAQNAMRVARTETNMAYRAADNVRWEQLDFIRGIHIQPSESHPAPDICDTLKGDYPKTFKFSGWHPQCFCIMTPITVSDDEMVAMADARRDGMPYEPETPEINDYPDNFKGWVERNADNIMQARERGTEPYFLRDNAEATNRFMRYAETILVGNDEYTVRQLINESNVIQTKNGKVYLHPAHGFDEREENIEFASWRANNFGEEVILLPNPQGAKSPDSFNITRGVLEEYKRSQSPSKNSISQLIRKGSEQADHIIIEPHGDIKRGVLESGIKGRVNQCGIKEVRIKIGEYEALYSRNTILSPEGFKIRPEDFHNAVVSRNEVQGSLSPISDAKLNKIFESTKSEQKLTPKQIADARHAARTPEHIAKIQSAWNSRRLTRFDDAVAKGLLSKDAVASLRALNDAKAFEAFKRKATTLSKVAKRHAGRTKADVNNIKNAWSIRGEKISIKAEIKAFVEFRNKMFANSNIIEADLKSDDIEVLRKRLASIKKSEPELQKQFKSALNDVSTSKKKLAELEAKITSNEGKELLAKAKTILNNQSENRIRVLEIDEAQKILKQAEKHISNIPAPPTGKYNYKQTDALTQKQFEAFCKKYRIDIRDINYEIKDGYIRLGEYAHQEIADCYKQATDQEEDIVIGGKRAMGRQCGYLATTNYRRINGCLRDTEHGGKYASKSLKLDIKQLKAARTRDNINKIVSLADPDIETIKTLDSLIARNSLPFPIEVIRNMDFGGINAMFGGKLNENSQLAKQLSSFIGNNFGNDAGFMSTSTCADENVFKGRPFQLQIRIPKGHSLYFSDHADESELVLARLSQMRLIKVLPHGEKGYLLICDLL